MEDVKFCKNKKNWNGKNVVKKKSHKAHKIISIAKILGIMFVFCCCFVYILLVVGCMDWNANRRCELCNKCNVTVIRFLCHRLHLWPLVNLMSIFEKL